MTALTELKENYYSGVQLLFSLRNEIISYGLMV
jgi:hypothetical protein